MRKPSIHLWLSACLLAFSFPVSAIAQAAPAASALQEPEMLTAFGGRPAISPDGRRVAFVGKTYGDAFEIDLETREIRNLTAGFPHQGIMRIQYLPNGDYLITGPRRNSGANSRAHLEMWVLDKDLRLGLRPLNEQVFEGIAVSRQSNLIAWTVIEPELAPDESWQLAFVRTTKRYAAEIAYANGTPVLVNKREIMADLPPECAFIEPQDFRAGDNELVYSCMGPMMSGLSISVMGTRLDNGQSTTYFRRAGIYAEVEGVAPDGSWATVECGAQDRPGIPPLDICRVEMAEDSELPVLLPGTITGLPGDICNPVISPDGRWMVFQRSDSQSGEIGEGYGLYIVSVDRGS